MKCWFSVIKVTAFLVLYFIVFIFFVTLYLKMYLNIDVVNIPLMAERKNKYMPINHSPEWESHNIIYTLKMKCLLHWHNCCITSYNYSNLQWSVHLAKRWLLSSGGPKHDCNQSTLVYSKTPGRRGGVKCFNIKHLYAWNFVSSEW